MRCIFSCCIFILFAGSGFSQDTISVVLSPATPGNKIPYDFAGLSYEKNTLYLGYFGPSKDTLARLFHTLQIGCVRIGGNTVDEDTFSTVNTRTLFNKADIDSFYLFMRNVGCSVLYGLNLGGWFNPSLASSEVSYIMSNYAGNVTGFEVGNEPDLYRSNGFRPSYYKVSSYDSQYVAYYDTITKHTPNAPITGPVAANNYSVFTLPFCRNMHGLFTMLTQHYYIGAANALSTRQQIVNVLNPVHQAALLTEVNALVQCADSANVPFRMGETNSLYNGGQWGVSDAFVSALWALDYMYALAATGCAGVNFHGGLSGAYTPLAYSNKLYSVRPLGYGIMAFNAGSRGRLIPVSIINDSINLSVYSVIDSLNDLYTTVINKDTIKDAFIHLDAGSNRYNAATYINLSASSLGDTTGITLGGRAVATDGTSAPYNWQPLSIAANKVQVLVPAGSAAIIHFAYGPMTGISLQKALNTFTLSPNPVTTTLTVASTQVIRRVVIMDLLGRTVYMHDHNSLQVGVNVANLQPGVYIIKVNDGDVMRFVK